MERVAFIGVFLVGFIFFVWRRRIDPLTVAFGGSAIYFSPGLAGFARFSYGPGVGEYYQPLAMEIYITMVLVLISLCAAAYAIDRLCPAGCSTFAWPSEAIVPWILLVAGSASLFVSLRTIGPFYLCLDKNITLAHIDQWYYYAANALVLAFVASIATQQRVVAALCAVALLADVVIGFRVNAAIAIIGLLTLIGGWLFESRSKAIKFIIILAFCGAALFVVKQFAYALKYGTAWVCETARLQQDEAVARRDAPIAEPAVNAASPSALESRPPAVEFYHSVLTQASIGQLVLNAFTYSEPFLTVAIFNETVKREFSIPFDLLTQQLLTGVPGGKSIFNIDSTDVRTFNDYFQPALFPKAITFGMANNPWAEAYAAGRLPMVFAFSVGFAAIMALITFGFWRTSGPVRALFAVLGGLIGFYFHRNDLLIEVGMVKHAIYIMAIALAVTWIADAVWTALPSARTSTN
jgi:hypothetical protein